MPTRPRHLIAGALLVVASLAPSAAGRYADSATIASVASAASQESSGIAAQTAPAALYTTYCAQCHEGPRADAQAPSLEAMKRLTAEQVLESLERGSMRARAAERSRAQRRALAAYVSGKPLVVDASGAMPKSAFCSAAGAPPPNVSGPMWNGWGHGITNARFQSTEAAGLTAGDLPRLRLRWAFGFPGATSAGTQPVVAGGRVYAATAEGELYVLDAKTGCVHWTLEVESGIRSAITLEQRASGELVAYFGDQSASVYAVDAKAGKVLWKVEVDDHPHAAVTAAPQFHDGRLYVPVSSREESQVADPRYPCCSFRGSVVALEATTGKRLWKTYTVSQTPVSTAKNSIGTHSGPAIVGGMLFVNSGYSHHGGILPGNVLLAFSPE